MILDWLVVPVFEIALAMKSCNLKNKFDANLPFWLRQEMLKLPEEGNATAHQMAQQWRKFYASDEAYSGCNSTWFRKVIFITP